VNRPWILVAYHSQEGQAEKVAEHIADTLRAGGATVELQPARQAPAPEGFDGVVLGDSIHVGQHSKDLTRYVMDHAASLSALPSALFQVSLTSASDERDNTDQAAKMVHQFSDQTGFDPDLVGMFAGALAYTRYGWVKRRVLKHIAAKDLGATDTTRDYEFTDWDAVSDFARAVLDHVRASRPSSVE
jgi:menaquinone-dependent protoporphyrinogen oxidase